MIIDAYNKIGRNRDHMPTQYNSTFYDFYNFKTFLNIYFFPLIPNFFSANFAQIVKQNELYLKS